MPTFSGRTNVYLQYLETPAWKPKPKKSVQFFKGYDGALPKRKKKTRFFQRFQAARARCQQAQK